METSNIQAPLNTTQMMLLRLFSRPMPEQRMKEIKRLLLQYYTQNLHEAVEKAISEKAISEKGITDEIIDAKLNQQQRSK